MTDAPQTDPAPETQPTTPPWGDDFSPERAWQTIQNLREVEKNLSKREVLTDDQKTKLSEYDRLVAAGQTETERLQATLVEAQEREAANAALADSLLRRAVQAEVKAAATNFADPADATAFLANDFDNFITEDGEIDTAKVNASVADLLEKKPWLKGSTEPTRRAPAPDPSQGKGATTAAGQLTREDLKSMSPQEIVKARSEGRLNDVLGTK